MMSQLMDFVSRESMCHGADPPNAPVPWSMRYVRNARCAEQGTRNLGGRANRNKGLTAMTKLEFSLCPSRGQQTNAGDTLCATGQTIMPPRAVLLLLRLPEPADGRDPMPAVPTIGCLA